VPQGEREVVVPLIHDSEFYNLLLTALHSLAAHLDNVRDDFIKSLRTLSGNISRTARPLSASHSSTFQPRSSDANPAAIGTSMFFGGAPKLKSDLSAWREIFQLYIESEVFESPNEYNRGSLPAAEAEVRLRAFASRVTDRGLGDRRTLKLKQSRDALQTFLQLNLLLLDLKKFQEANSEAMRKILKKHAKRTALPLPPFSMGSEPNHDDCHSLVIPSTLHSLPRILVQAISETLLPVIPSIDDYSCAICTSIAFKPIRLNCGHLFCVRCLVKMQKRGKDNCPMCRAPTVIQADRSNVDWALLNFMQDWFPEESYKKLRNNEREATEEQLIEMGIAPSSSCIIC